MSQSFFWRLVAGYILGALLFFFLFPFFLFALGNSLSWGLLLPPTYRMLVFLVLSVWGIYWVVWANLQLLEVSPPTKTLVKSGPYVYVRHPMAMGMLAFYLGLCFLFNSLLALLLWVGVVFIAKTYLEKVEEKKLAEQFGESYLEYQKKTPALWMWGRKK